jgi:hypothetical protein
MVLNLSFFVGFSSLGRAMKVSKVYQFIETLNLCLPFSTRFDKGYTYKPRSISGELWEVLLVLKHSGFSKIAKSIVISNPIDVINLIFRPSTCAIQPSYPMHSIGFSRKMKPQISASCFSSSYLTTKIANALSVFPSKYASIRVVIKTLSYKFCCKIGISHAFSPVKKWFGQKPSCVISTSGLRYFNGNYLTVND